MMTSVLIVSAVCAVAAAWWVNSLWSQWDKQYRAENKRPPPGGDGLGYAAVIVACLVTMVIVSKLLLVAG